MLIKRMLLRSNTAVPVLVLHPITLTVGGLEQQTPQDNWKYSYQGSSMCSNAVI